MDEMGKLIILAIGLWFLSNYLNSKPENSKQEKLGLPVTVITVILGFMVIIVFPAYVISALASM